MISAAPEYVEAMVAPPLRRSLAQHGSRSDKATAPSGRLIQKIKDHERCWAKKPPMTGPAMLEVAQTVEM